MVNHVGCDSVILTNLTVRSENRITIDTSICLGDTIFVFGEEVTSSGSFVDTFTDVNTCDSIVTVNVAVFSAFTVTTAPVDAACFNRKDGAVSVNSIGGIPPYTFVLALPTGTDIRLVGYFDSLDAGMYSGYVIDDNGCRLEFDFTIDQPDSLYAVFSTQNATCFKASNGALFVSLVSGGIPPYEIRVNDQVADSLTITGLPAGMHNLTVTDANTCTFTSTFSINQPDSLVAFVVPDSVSGKPGDAFAINVTHTPVSGQFTYLWTPAKGLSCIDCPNPVVSPYESGRYVVRVSETSDSDIDCYANGYLVVVIDETKDIFIPNAFTPNDDGFNDVLLFLETAW